MKFDTKKEAVAFWDDLDHIALDAIAAIAKRSEIPLTEQDEINGIVDTLDLAKQIVLLVLNTLGQSYPFHLVQDDFTDEDF